MMTTRGRQPQPETADDLCKVCRRSAPYIDRERATGKVTRYCRTHLPWPEYKLPLTWWLEAEYLKRKSPPASA